jgi:hypothetical protein
MNSVASAYVGFQQDQVESAATWSRDLVTADANLARRGGWVEA